MITKLLEKEGRQLGVINCHDWKELVDRLAAPLIAEGVVTKEFRESAKEAAEKYGGYVVLVDDIAFFHGRPEDGVKEISMTLALPDTPVYLFEKRIKAAFLFAATDTNSHGDVLRAFAQIMGDEECLKLLRDSKDPAAIIKKCKEVEEVNEVS